VYNARNEQHLPNILVERLRGKSHYIIRDQDGGYDIDIRKVA